MRRVSTCCWWKPALSRAVSIRFPMMSLTRDGEEAKGPGTQRGAEAATVTVVSAS